MTEPQYSHHGAAADSGQSLNDVWRKEIHSRVARFRTRRGRRIEGAFSMRFPFPPPEPVAALSEVSAEASSAEFNVAVGEIADTTTVKSEPESFSIDVAPDSPKSVTDCIVASDRPELAAAPAAVQETPAAESRAVESATPEATPPHFPEAQPAPPPVMQPRPRPKRKVIAFPRQPGTADGSNRLADPVLPEQPRILDVPEELEAYPSTPFLEGLQFEPTPSVSALHVDRVELPFRAAGIPQRLYAALVDCSVVALAAVVFAVVGHKMLPDLVLTKPVRLTAALVSLLIWGIYQYLLLVYAGRTVGMQVAGIRLSTFKGRQLTLRHRRNRVFGHYLSTASLAMGLLWAFVDVDTLCWHDRISATYLSRRD